MKDWWPTTGRDKESSIKLTLNMLLQIGHFARIALSISDRRDRRRLLKFFLQHRNLAIVTSFLTPKSRFGCREFLFQRRHLEMELSRLLDRTRVGFGPVTGSIWDKREDGEEASMIV